LIGRLQGALGAGLPLVTRTNGFEQPIDFVGQLSGQFSARRIPSSGSIVQHRSRLARFVGGEIAAQPL
jgi:hypothetical protein